MSMDCNGSFECTPEMEEFLCERLLDQREPISERFRALFSLRNLRGDRPREALVLGSIVCTYSLGHSYRRPIGVFMRENSGIIDALAKEIIICCRPSQGYNILTIYYALWPDTCFDKQRMKPTIGSSPEATRDPSNLLAHEAAFALGQMQDADAIHPLQEVLKDLSLHPIVRHEAAEALGAIGAEGAVSLLKDTLLEDPILEVQETCELALRRIMEQNINYLNGTSTKDSPYHTIDPAIPASLDSSVDQLREVLFNEEEGIYERYAALFALRNRGDDAAVRAIIESLDARSALLRHEVAYVLGQLQHKMATSALVDILRNVNEHPMVRHEAAEALGSIADSESIELLQEFVNDPEPIVSQSCEVALSMLEFERDGKPFEFFFMEPPDAK